MERKIDSCGRLLLPMEIRRNLGWEAGDTVSYVIEGNSVIVRKKGANICKYCGLPIHESKEIEIGLCHKCQNSLRNLLF